MTLSDKRNCVDPEAEISINNQCLILHLSKGSLYYKARPKHSFEDLKILQRMREVYSAYPIYGYRKLYAQLKRERFVTGRDRVLKYMRILGIQSICVKGKKKTSIPNKDHKKYPYLLNDLNIDRPNQVWAVDITYIRLKGGFVYFVAIIDWYSKYILSYRVSNSLEVSFCKEALSEAIERYGSPEILNSDQGSQFTSYDFTNMLLDNKISISMDSKGRAIDNRIIERFFRSLKYENVYIYEYDTVKDVKSGIREYIQFYNTERLHQTLKYKTPAEVYFTQMPSHSVRVGEQMEKYRVLN